MDQNLTWDDTYEIAFLLSQHRSRVNLSDVSLGNILDWTRELPGFSDDVSVNDETLMDIFCIWYEEAISK
jgi:FeS assembly protein IscX